MIKSVCEREEMKKSNKNQKIEMNRKNERENKNFLCDEKKK